MKDTEQKLFEQLVKFEKICKNTEVKMSFRMCTDCKPWAITALIEANLLQLSEIAQKCKENEIPVIVQFDYDMGEWHNPTENTRSFGLCINEETSSMFAFDDNIDE